MNTGGVDLVDALERLVGRGRGRGRLAPAPDRDALGPSSAEAVPTGADPSRVGGPVSPLVEQAYAGATFYSWVSSDGLFILEFGHETTLIDDNGAGDTYVIAHDDPAT